MVETVDDKLVSIIIPTYNRSDYLIKAIHSALNQTYKNIEVIVVDDNSQDNTKSRVFEINDKRIKYLKNIINKGGAYSRNIGFKKSKGVFVNFLDDDDILYPNKIALQIQKFKFSTDERLGVVTCDVKYNRTDIHTIKSNRKKGYIYKDLLKAYCIFGTETMLIKREFFIPFDIDLKSNQEYDLSIRLSKKCTFDYVPQVLTEKNESINQVSFNFDKKIGGTKFLFKKYKNEFKDEGIYFYNLIRFFYLLFKYYVGKYLGLRVYKYLK